MLASTLMLFTISKGVKHVDVQQRYAHARGHNRKEVKKMNEVIVIDEEAIKRIMERPDVKLFMNMMDLRDRLIAEGKAKDLSTSGENSK